MAGIVFTALALWVYRNRTSESAGDTVAIGWARPVFRFGVAVCCALSFGQGLYYLIWSQFTNQETASLAAMMACIILLGLVGLLGAAMRMQKSFRVVQSSKNRAAG